MNTEIKGILKLDTYENENEFQTLKCLNFKIKTS